MTATAPRALRAPAPAPPPPAAPHRRWGAAWHGTASVLVVSVAVLASLLTLAVAMGNPWLQARDEDLLDRLRDVGPTTLLRITDRLGATGVAVAACVATALLLRRQRPQLALAHASAVAAGIAANVLLKLVVDRPRPASPAVGTALPSYPSGHTIQAVLLAVFATAAVHELGRRRWLSAAVGALLGTGAALTGVGRVVFGAHWPSDVVGGSLIAASVAVVALLAVHAPPASRDEPTGLLVLPEELAGWARLVARWTSIAAVVGFAGLWATLGIPREPDAGLAGAHAEVLVQGALLLLSAAGAALAWRWEAVGAGVLTSAGTAMALFSSVQYRPAAALAVAVSFLLPALLFWVAWMHGRPARSLLPAVVIGFVLLAATWSGAVMISDHHLGG